MYHSKTIGDVIKELQSSKNGLTEKEAEKRLKNNGFNKLNEAKKESNFKKFIKEFKDIMIIILIMSAGISFALAVINHESFIDSIAIIFIVILNAIMGYIQEIKADKALESLKKMQINKVKVKRDNIVKEIDSKKLVIGDLILLEAGGTVPADARIIWESSLKCDESSLTGESNPLNKSIESLSENTPLAERKNMIYSGSPVVYGKCHAIVTATGMNTEIGKIAKYLEHEENEITPLEIKINNISKFLSVLISIIIFVMFIIGLLKGMKLLEIIMLSISLAVAAIPEGLPAVITIIQSLGVSFMAKNNAVIRKLSSVETLGCTEVICSDKTGTITQNKMSVREIYYDNRLINIDEIPTDHFLLDIMALNNDTVKSENSYIGDPTEIALYNVCENKLIDIDKLNELHCRINELPFDSDRKMMSTINEYDNCIKILTKGSFDSIINNCDKILENGVINKLTKKKKLELKKIEEQESDKAYRLLAFAFKDLDKQFECDKNLENKLIFVGLAAMIDPPRKDVYEAITMCKKANIKPVMITGDSLKTAEAIASEIGILTDKDKSITGVELDKLSDKELQEKVSDYSVYARVSPMNKLSIVNAWKANGKIVAMTGDGVNDAPALKNANIGVGMGITGTEVSKNVSDVILSDDSFSTIVTAVREGRRIYDNIRNVLVYLLTGNISEVLVVFIAMIFGTEIFSPIQLLYINLITDSIPAIALAFEESAKDIMQRKTSNRKTFFTQFLTVKMITSAILKTVAVLAVYLISYKMYSINIAATQAFLTLVFLEMIFTFSCRNLKESMLGRKMLENKYINKSMLILIVFQLIIFLTPLRRIFGIAKLNIIQILSCAVVVIIIYIIDEITKKIFTKILKD